MNKFEGRLLICHAFAFRELAAAAAEAGWSAFGHRRFPVNRQAILAGCRSVEPSPQKSHAGRSDELPPAAHVRQHNSLRLSCPGGGCGRMDGSVPEERTKQMLIVV